MKKMVLLGEAVTITYCLALMWFLFPQWHSPLRQAWRSMLWQWQLGQAQLRLASSAGWMQEAAVVRGKLPAGPPRPFNFPE